MSNSGNRHASSCLFPTLHFHQRQNEQRRIVSSDDDESTPPLLPNNMNDNNKRIREMQPAPEALAETFKTRVVKANPSTPIPYRTIHTIQSYGIKIKSVSVRASVRASVCVTDENVQHACV